MINLADIFKAGLPDLSTIAHQQDAQLQNLLSELHALHAKLARYLNLQDPADAGKLTLAEIERLIVEKRAAIHPFLY